MCERLAELKEAMVAVAAAFDPVGVGEAGASEALAEATAIEHIAATIKARAAAWLAAGGRWRRSGGRSPADDLARRAGISVGAAREALELGSQLEARPRLAAAAARGELSPSQARLIACAAPDPAAEGRLLADARRVSLAELADEAGRIRAAAENLEDRRRRVHGARRLRSWTDPEGAWHLAALGNPEDGARVMAALEPLKDRAFRAARAGGCWEPVEAHAFDTLVTLADPPVDSPGRPTKAPAKLIARVDLDALLRGYPSEGETCELVGYGPVAVSAVGDLIESGDPFLAAVATRGEAVVGVAHLGRRPIANQRTALEWIYPACAVEGCPAQARLEIDHRVDWAESRVTLLDLLDRLCSHHHALKTRSGWALVEGRGKRPFVSPDDPRHPRQGTGGVCPRRPP
jgi:hypothetical protein